MEVMIVTTLTAKRKTVIMTTRITKHYLRSRMVVLHTSVLVFAGVRDQLGLAMFLLQKTKIWVQRIGRGRGLLAILHLKLKSFLIQKMGSHLMKYQTLKNLGLLSLMMTVTGRMLPNRANFLHYYKEILSTLDLLLCSTILFLRTRSPMHVYFGKWCLRIMFLALLECIDVSCVKLAFQKKKSSVKLESLFHQADRIDLTRRCGSNRFNMAVRFLTHC